MAAPIPSSKVKDKEYSNWLKVTLALYYMKSGLHSFIQSEVDCLHQSLIHKIYGGQTVPLPPCTMCHASRVKRNKFTGVWGFQKRCRSYCDVWLDELLVLHTSPMSDKIYWNNSDIPSWPFQPWECAKVYMPRGQQPSTAGPSECDAQALLTLLASCTHFHPKLSPQGLGLTHTISSIRNKVMHDGEMKVSDIDRMSCIQQIIQLLEDPVSLVSLEDCKAAVVNIHKINNDSVDVFFNVDLEMTALRASVNELNQELGLERTRTLDTVDSLKEEYRQLREQVAKRLEDVETRMDIIERDVQSVMKQTDTVLQQQEKKHQQSMENMSASIAKQGVRLDTVEETLVKLHEEIGQVSRGNNSCMKGKLHQNVLNQCLPALMSDLDFKPVCMYIQQKGLIDDVTMHDISEERTTSVKTMRLIQWIQQGSQDTYEKFKECLVQAKQENLKEMLEEEEANFAIDQGKGTLTKRRRQQSDGLKQLKNQTEDKLDTLARLEYIQTTQTEKAQKLLEEKRSIVIRGNPGEGKTTMALHLIDNEIYRNRRVVLYCPRHWETVDTDWVDIVMLEDVFGQFDLDPGHLQQWMVYLPTIQEHVDAGKLQVIITSRADILSKAYSRLASLKLFADDLSLTLSSEKLTNSEKMNILNRELCRHTRKMKENEKEKCITNFSGLIGFPQCCSLFAVDNNLFDRGPDFFSSPKKFFVNNITELEPTRFLPLAFLFCNGKICEEYLSPDTMPKTSKHLFRELSSCLSEEKADITLLRNVYDRFLELYVLKCMSHDFSLGHAVEKSSIQFTHATVCEAVGQVLGDRCLEMVVKYGDSEYLYQRTYTAETKDSTSENVFLPVCVYGLLAERMVSDVVEKGLAGSVVKHSALKQGQFLKTLKGELHKSNRIMKFLMANPYPYQTGSITVYGRLLEGECVTFLQYILQSDEDIVRLVYNEFLELLECAHNTNKPGCCHCEEKQKLLELALYYQHFEIADRLIIKNANYTCVSLCNAARHGHLKRVQTILETLKRSHDLNPELYEAKEALYRAYISGNQSLIDVLLKEDITLDSMHVVDVVRHGDVNTLKKVVEHLKCHDKWNPHLEQYQESSRSRFSFEKQYLNNMDSLTRRFQHVLPSMYSGKTKRHEVSFLPEIDEVIFTKALHIAYCDEKFDMADYLLKNQVKVSMHILASVSKSGSQQAVDRVIQNLKLTGIWDPYCHDASNALEKAFHAQKYDVCDLLIQERVSLTMENLPGATRRLHVSFESIKKVIQHLKDTDSWDPKCYHASEALANAYILHKLDLCKYDICDLLVKEGVSLTMVHIPHVTMRSLDCVKMAVKQLKDTDSWDPKCDNASYTLVNAYHAQKYDVCDLLIQEGVSLTMNGLHQVILFGSLEAATKAIKQLKDTDGWDPKCVKASDILQTAYCLRKYEVCDLLVYEGVSLSMKHIPSVILRSLDDVKKTLKQLKDAKLWDPKCDDAYKALEYAYCSEKYEQCDLLIHEGVSLTMKGLFKVIIMGSLESAKKAIKQLKDSASWDPMCDNASEALANAFIQQKYELCDLLIQEGFLLTMKSLIVPGFMESSESVTKAVEQLKSTNQWDPNCDEASEALANAYRSEKYDVCDLLVQEGVSLTMKSFPGVVGNLMVSWQAVKKAIKQLKDTESWDPKCDDASKALENAYKQQKYDIYDLLIQEGVSLTMKHLQGVILRAPNYVKKAVKQLKDTNSWDPECDDASNALAIAYSVHRYNICNLLIQEGVSLTMKSLLLVICSQSLESARKSIQQLKDTGCWDPECDDASKALKKAYKNDKDEVCDLLVKEGVKITMRHLPAVSVRSLYELKTAVKQLKDTERWDSKCDDASKALAKAYSCGKFDVSHFLLQEGVTLTMKNLPHVLSRSCVSLQSVKKAVQHLKETNQWISSSDYVEKVLSKTKSRYRKDICDFLANDGVCFPHLDK